MTRQHIHLALSTPPPRTASKAEGKVTSGIRATSTYLLYLDVPMLLERTSLSFSLFFLFLRRVPLTPRRLLHSPLHFHLPPSLSTSIFRYHRQRPSLPLHQRRPSLPRRSERFLAREDRTRLLPEAGREEDREGCMDERRCGRWCEGWGAGGGEYRSAVDRMSSLAGDGRRESGRGELVRSRLVFFLLER